MSPHRIIKSLRYFRNKRGISQADMAHTVGIVGQSGLARLEAGKHSPKLSTIVDWADALDFKIVIKSKGRKKRNKGGRPKKGPPKRRAIYMSRNNLVLVDGAWRVAP